jgi:hypothetical protein
MKVGDVVYAKHPRMYGAHKPGIIVKTRRMYQVGAEYQVYFSDIGLKWIKFSHNLILFEEMWDEE